MPGGSAVGHTLDYKPQRLGDPEPQVPVLPYTIIGVLPDAYDGQSLFTPPGPTIFFSHAQYPMDSKQSGSFFLIPSFAVRSTLPQAALEKQLRAALAEAAPDLVLDRIATFEADFSATLTTQRLALRLGSGFGLLALVLAAVGLYGVLAAFVGQRRREIGIRLALGASRGQAVRLVLQRAAGMFAFGLGAGLLAAWPATRAMRGFLYGVAPLDPLSFAAAPMLLTLVGALAAWVPARRAALTDPAEALRSE